MYIYKTTNKLNGKIYIGLQTKPVEKTMDYLGSGVHLNNSIKKYGKENFTKEIICDNVEDVETLKKLEKFYIEKFNSYNDGYNLTTGGDGAIGYRYTEEQKIKLKKAQLDSYSSPAGIKRREEISARVRLFRHSEKTKTQMALIKTGLKHKQESIDKMSAIKKGVKQTPESIEARRAAMMGHEVSQETKEKIKNSLKGKYTGEKSSFWGRHHTQETKEKIGKANSIKLTGRKMPPETVEKCRVALLAAYASGRRKRISTKGENNGFFGRKHSAESIEKMRLASINQWKNRKAI
jgi:group I intron endonuclease